MKLGKIPKKLKLYCRPETTIRFRWSDVEFEDPSAANITATPVFITDAENPKTQKTAEDWASALRWSWDPDTGARVKSRDQYTLIERDNDPVKSVRIVDLDIRGNGGRAYRAFVDEKYLVDMREDVMLDTMINVGMGVNATLPGEYIFAQIGAEMKLIRVGSKLHEMMVESTAFSEKKPINKLIPGRIYASKTKTILYLGEVWHTAITSGYMYGPRTGPVVHNVQQPRKAHLCVQISKPSSDLKIALGKDTTYFTASVELQDTQSKAYREELATIKDVTIEEMIDEIRRRIEVCYDDASMADNCRNNCGNDAGNIAYYSMMNISTTPGWIHPKIQQHLPK